MRKFCLFIAFFCSLSVFSTVYSPTTVPNPKQKDSRTYVANPDGVLSPSMEAQLNQLAASLQKEVEVELAVVAIEEMDGWSPDAFDFAQKLFNHWGIGAKGKNTGVLILLVTHSRDIRIHTGGGLEGLLPDAVCEEIVNYAMVPYLQNDKWDEGLWAGAVATGKRVTTDAAKAELLLGYTPKTSDVSDVICGYLMLAFLVLALLSIWVYKDQQLRGRLQHEQWIRAAMGSWQCVAIAGLLFPLPVYFLRRWYKQHGGKDIQALMDAQMKEQARKAARSGNGSGVYFGSMGGGRGGFGSGFGGGFSGGSFGGGRSFGGGFGRKF